MYFTLKNQIKETKREKPGVLFFFLLFLFLFKNISIQALEIFFSFIILLSHATLPSPIQKGIYSHSHLRI